MSKVRRWIGLWFRSSDTVSDQWLAGLRRSEDRVEFHGVCWKFPISSPLVIKES